MIIFKVICLAIVGLVVTIMLKNFNCTFAPVSALIVGLLMVYITMPYIKELIGMLRNISEINSELNVYFEIMIKTVVVALIGEFSAQLCSDAGETYLSSKIYLASKIIILYQVSPIFMKFIRTVIVMVQEL